MTELNRYGETVAVINTRWVFALDLVLASLACMGQSLEIVRVEQEGTKMNIYYDLVDNNPANRYSLQLFSSYDEYTKPLKAVTGDIGEKVIPGINRKITWDMTEYGSSFAQKEEKINFEIRGDLYAPFLVMDKHPSKLKKGKTYSFEWKTKPGVERLTAELLRGDEHVFSSSSVDPHGFSLTVPSNARAGKGYRLRISDPGNENNTYTTEPFTIRRRIPLVVYFVPVVVAVIIIATPPPPGEPQKLPDPLTPD